MADNFDFITEETFRLLIEAVNRAKVYAKTQCSRHRFKDAESITDPLLKTLVLSLQKLDGVWDQLQEDYGPEKTEHFRGMVQLYKRKDKDDLVETQWGTLTYLEWLKKEKERIEAGEGREARIHIAGRSVALYVDDATGI